MRYGARAIITARAPFDEMDVTMRMLGSSRRATSGTAIALVVVAGTLVAACKTPDSRAYAGSSNVSIDKELSQFELTVPKCADGMRYYVDDQARDGLLVKFTGSSACVQSFLTANKLTNPSELAGSDVLAAGQSAKGIWTFDPAKTYQMYASFYRAKTASVQLSVAVDATSDVQTVYVDAVEI